MTSERETPLNKLAQIASISPEQFNYSCDSLVDYQVPQSTYHNLTQILSQGRNVVLLTNHQSYFEIETQRHFSYQLKESLGDQFHSLLLYSAPAVEHNVGSFLKIRNHAYQQAGLSLLGIIRKEDYSHPVYKNNITQEMKAKHRENFKLFENSLNGTGNLFIFPYESSLEGGRLDPVTQKIKGMREADQNCLDVFIKRNIVILPCGIDGSYHLINPTTHHLSQDLISSIIDNKADKKKVTFKVGSLIDPQSQIELGFSYQDINHQAIVEVAKLVTPEARGFYSNYVPA